MYEYCLLLFLYNDFIQFPLSLTPDQFFFVCLKKRLDLMF